MPTTYRTNVQMSPLVPAEMNYSYSGYDADKDGNYSSEDGDDSDSCSIHSCTSSSAAESSLSSSSSSSRKRRQWCCDTAIAIASAIRPVMRIPQRKRQRRLQEKKTAPQQTQQQQQQPPLAQQQRTSIIHPDIKLGLTTHLTSSHLLLLEKKNNDKNNNDIDIPSHDAPKPCREPVSLSVLSRSCVDYFHQYEHHQATSTISEDGEQHEHGRRQQHEQLAADRREDAGNASSSLPVMIEASCSHLERSLKTINMQDASRVD
jgi:hypothetical protein